MTRLAAFSELDRLQATLGLPDALAEEMKAAGISSTVLRDIRLALNEAHYGIDEPIFRRLAWIASRLPALAVRWLATQRFGPHIVARVAVFMGAKRVSKLAEHLPDDFLAQVTEYLDPRFARDIIIRLPSQQIIRVAHVLIEQKAYITMGRFVDFLADDTIRDVLESVEEEEELVRIAYYMESKNRLDHVMRMMPLERLRKAILLVLEPERDLMLQLMSLVFHTGYDLQHELGELAAEQDESVLNQIAGAAQDNQLWADLLPVISRLSVETQGKVVNLPIVRERPVLEAILAAAEEALLWRDLLPLLPLMELAMRESVADIATGLTPSAMRDVAEAALMTEQWEPMAEIVSYMPESKQREVVQVLKDFGNGIDDELEQRLVAVTEKHGFGHIYRELVSAAATPAELVVAEA